jgi:hypothetical protein
MFRLALVRRVGAVAVIVLAAASCKKARPAGMAPPPSLRPDASISPTSERGKDDLWQRATGGDESDLARLADREGAKGLLDGLEEGGAIGVAALDALPLADDAEAAYERLGEIARHIDRTQAGPVVRAIYAIAAKPARQIEPVDPAGMKSCALALLDLANDKSLAAGLRAPVISVLRLLATRNAVDPALIPSDLDPK